MDYKIRTSITEGDLRQQDSSREVAELAPLLVPKPQFPSSPCHLTIGRPTSMQSGFKKPGKDGMNIFRAVMITGPPGIGKTTSAHLCAKLEGYTPIELNASDARSKKLVEVRTAFNAYPILITLSELDEYQQYLFGRVLQYRG